MTEQSSPGLQLVDEVEAILGRQILNDAETETSSGHELSTAIRKARASAGLRNIAT